jgi:hypothetical protein
MNQIANREDFNTNIKILADMSNSTKYKNNDYLLFFSLGERDESLIITITEGFNYLWAKELDFDDFEKIRKDLGFQGTYANFFTLFREAILMTNGSFKIEIHPSNSDLDLTVYYKITKSATLTGVINIGSPMHYEQDKSMFRQFIRKTLIDLQNSKRKEAANLEREVFELKEKLKAAEDKITVLSKNMPNVPQSLPQADEPAQDQKKKKSHGDLINPNLKRRKAVGAKIGGG